MKLNIEIKTGETCSFNIKDTSVYADTFVGKDFTYKNSVTVCLIGKQIDNEIKFSEEDIYLQEHNDEFKKLGSDIPTNFDGHFVLKYLVIPKYDEREVTGTTTLYYFDQTNNLFKGNDIVPLSELLNETFEETNISFLIKEFVSICHLKKCFIEKCKKIFNQRVFSDCAYRGKIDSDLVFDRDLMWMAINVISYLTSFNNLEEAHRIINLISECNECIESQSSGGCGCS